MKPEVAADAAAEIAMVPAEIPGETASPPEAGTPAEEPPAAAGLGGGGGGDEAKEYRLKDIQWVDAATGREREVKIATQNENGPCPLLALANVLALTGRVQLGRAAQRTASGGELAAAVANLLLDQPGGSSSGDAQAVLTLLPRLHTGLDVDLRFSHVRGFAPTPGARLFAAFGVPLVHGWVVDPQADPAVARALAGCGDSYEGAVEYVLAADELSSSVIGGGGGGSAAAGGGELDAAQQQRVCDAAAVHEWLQATATQLTDRGLQMLQAELAPGSLSVLFRNNHFSTLLRHADGRLFVLCTDDVVAAEPRLVWESLADVRQARSHFVDSRFRPLDAHGADDYARQGNAAATAASHEQAQADQIDSDFALALRLHEEEEEEEEERRRRHRQQAGGLQVRQHDRPPPGMDVRPGDPLFNVPEVTRDGESRLARAMHRSRSDDSFGRQMQAAFLPNEAARPGHPPRQQQQRQRPPPPPPPAQDRCIIT
ncbi:hypothetical protein H4R21_005095 [Coemansia helicoidea]|uniref:Uncharacterized protein n=1 Tax=Coemansia helicoidea TaxID=1286919 RepID=A0ACC1KUR2_9FUNG|nr:hypothetical protein H4R21_005095 [Coemansia helicoidea]